MEFWAQQTVSPMDGRVGWTVVDDRYVEHPRAAEYLRVLVDGEGRSIGTARTYAGRIALYLTWSGTAGVDELSPSVEQLASSPAAVPASSTVRNHGVIRKSFMSKCQSAASGNWGTVHVRSRSIRLVVIHC